MTMTASCCKHARTVAGHARMPVSCGLPGMLAAVFLLLAACAHEGATNPSVNPAAVDQLAKPEPRLAVVIVVDQMRAGYLSELEDAMHGGLHQLSTEGTRFHNAWVDHAYTNSFPGHTSALTGSYPRNHGVTDNVWHEAHDSGPVIRSVLTLVGRRDGAPYELGRKTLVEWFLAHNPRSRFAAIGSNDATQVYAGALSGPVYWLSGSGEGYVTGANFGPAIPEWVRSFNAGRLTELASHTWESSIPEETIRRLRPDDVPFENRGENTHFPFSAAASGMPPLEWLSKTPFSDQATLELASIAVSELGLGQDDVVDVLAISLSSLDSIGHAYGPFSHEQTDAVLRLDRNLGTFMKSLDDKVGPGLWVLSLTADHGVAPMPEGLRVLGSAEGRRISSETARQVAVAAYAAADAVKGREAKAEAAARAIEAFDFVERAFTESELSEIRPDPVTPEGLFALSYVPGRIAVHPFYFRDLAIADLGVFVLLKENIMIDWGAAIHGSPYDYDRRVPVLFYGPGIVSCDRFDRAATVDVAPTLAAIAQIRPSDSVDGRVLDLSAGGCAAGSLSASYLRDVGQ